MPRWPNWEFNRNHTIKKLKKKKKKKNEAKIKNEPEAPSSFPQRIAISWRPQEKIYINHRVGVVKQ
jgi:hypothetical protein